MLRPIRSQTIWQSRRFRQFETSNHQLATIGTKQKFLQSLPRATVDLAIGLFLVLLSNPNGEALNTSLFPIFSVGYVLYRIIPAAIKIANAYNGIFFSKQCLENISRILKENLESPKKSELLLTISQPVFQVKYRGKQYEYTLGHSVKITGVSGSGKTTLCRALVGMAKPQNLLLQNDEGIVFDANTIYLHKTYRLPWKYQRNLFVQSEEQIMRACEYW